MPARLSNWTNLQDIFKANAGQGARMTNDVFGSIEGQADQAQQQLGKAGRGFRDAASRAALDSLAGAKNITADQAEKAGQQQYNGPRTLKEYDPNVGASIADAAQRVNASRTTQLAGQYGRTSATGSALDAALMNNEGGQAREAKVKGKFGTLLDQLRAEQQATQQYGTQQAGVVAGNASRYGAMVPELRQSEALAKRAAEDRALQDRNNAAREQYDQQWAARTRRFQNRRGNQLQAAYRPPESEVLPFYPAS